jgi:hypothetical protein
MPEGLKRYWKMTLYHSNGLFLGRLGKNQFRQGFHLLYDKPRG